MSENNYCARLSPEELLKLNEKKKPLTPQIPRETMPQMIVLSEKQWEQVTMAMDDILNESLIHSEQILNLQNIVSEIVRTETEKALSAQCKETEQMIQKLAKAAEVQVGRAAEKAGRRIGWQGIMDSFLWGLSLIAMALPTVLVLALAVYMGWLPLFQ